MAKGLCFGLCIGLKVGKGEFFKGDLSSARILGVWPFGIAYVR